ncbi:MAG: LD-carboxypeptidase [Oligoflexia bacterium]|nr:LD-carboxypeptidase [Oligoflexia bacterium]
MVKLKKLQKGDKVAILSPSFAAPGRWPHVYELGLQRVKEIFELEPVEFPTTKKIGASAEERSKDLIDAFENTNIKAIISSIGGDDQITYIKNLPKTPFVNNPKPFFGYSDNTHFANFLMLNGIPSFYGGSLFVQFAEQGKMNEYTIKYLKHALFDDGEIELQASKVYNDIGLNWNDPETLNKQRLYEANVGWIWEGDQNAEGITWGGCIESIDELLRHATAIPTLDDFENIILLAETSEEMPSADSVRRIYRALGERGILERIKGLLVGRPKAWEFNKQNSTKEKEEYCKEHREMTLEIVRKYNSIIPIIQNLDFGHTDPQIPMPYGSKIRIESHNKKIFVTF